MPHPLLLEINTRCWLGGLSDHFGRRITLAAVPEDEMAAWKKSGFTHLWLMGVWATGPKTLALARAQPNLLALSEEAFGPAGGGNLQSSPYAVADFTVARSLGGAAALRQFRGQLHRYGLGLVLDFIPNHLGLDHRWLRRRTNLFVRSAAQRPETFPVVQGGATSWVAHGKDPHFPGWIDTAQLDYRLPATRAAITKTLLSVAPQCDGVRCDMAMLLLHDLFDRTWRHFPTDTPAPMGEFWAEAISTVKLRHPEFMFMAEAYWDLEPRLQSLGFDYVYDKKFLDHLTRRDYPALQTHIHAVAGKFRPVRFLENHDEARIASRLTVPEQKAAAVLLLSQPGLRLLHDGQMAGKQRHTPVQFARYWPEPDHPEMTAFYQRLLSSLPQTSIGQGKMEFCQTGVPHCFAMKWRQEDGASALVLVNLATHRADFQLQQFRRGCQITNVFSEHSNWSWKAVGLRIDLAGGGFALLQLSP